RDERQYMPHQRRARARRHVTNNNHSSSSSSSSNNNNNNKPANKSAIKPDFKVSAVVGQNVILNCAMQFRNGVETSYVVNWSKWGEKLPIYIWYAGYPPHTAPEYESRVSRIGQASLNLSQVHESDQGLYRCKIHYIDRLPSDDTDNNGTWVYLDVQAPPHFTRTPPAVSYVRAGEQLVLPCQADSTPPPTIRWLRNNQVIEDTASGPVYVRPASNELVIESVHVGQTTGDYVCQASNSEGTVEATASVQMAVPPIITHAPSNQTRLEGDRVEFMCRARALPPNITYEWLHEGTPIDASRAALEGRVARRPDGALVIGSVVAQDAGKYTCRASNGFTHDSVYPTATSTVGTNAPATMSHTRHAERSSWLEVEYPARVTYSPALQYLPLGMPGIIRCHVASSPALNYVTWTFNDDPLDTKLSRDFEELRNGSLLVRQAGHAHAGKYRCTPFNIHASGGSSLPMEVRVEPAPEFVMRPKEYYRVVNGSLARLPCDATGSPRPSISWRRHTILAPPLIDGASSASGQAGDDSSLFHVTPLDPKRTEVRDSHLIIRGVHKGDFGRYDCVVENDVATLISSTMLYVDETTPHAPTHLVVATSAWSATLKWDAGYDGGFEQTFTIYYRPALVATSLDEDRAHTDESLLLLSQVPATTATSQQQVHQWTSINVVPPGANKFTIQNLAHSTWYEFYVQPSNQLGNGTRSRIVHARTGRATRGTLTSPTRSHQLLHNESSSRSTDSEYEAVSLASVEQNNASVTHIDHNADEDDDAQPDPSAVLGSDPNAPVTAVLDTPLTDESTLYSVTPADGETATTLQHNSSNHSVSRSSSNTNSLDSNTNLSSLMNTSSISNSNSDDPNALTDSSSNSDTADQTHTSFVIGRLANPVNSGLKLAAPRNVTIMKVAQGWVVSWIAPDSVMSSDSKHEVAFYSVECREKGDKWRQIGPPVKETSFLVKDLKPGVEYFFRVVASSVLGTGEASDEIAFLLPDNRKKPGGAQALAAGVVGGILFFIAMIVLSVCTVKMCNERRRRRAEKAAYVMMACPVMDRHNDHTGPTFPPGAPLIVNN
ncbi:Protein turtle, partial [Fragariocoptes setiger]